MNLETEGSISGSGSPLPPAACELREHQAQSQSDSRPEYWNILRFKDVLTEYITKTSTIALVLFSAGTSRREH